MFSSREGLTHILRVIIPFWCYLVLLTLDTLITLFLILLDDQTQLAYCLLNIPRFFPPSTQYRLAQVLCMKQHLFRLILPAGFCSCLSDSLQSFGMTKS